MTTVPVITKFDVCACKASIVQESFFNGLDVGTVDGLDEYLYGKEEPTVVEGYLCIQKYSDMKEAVLISVSDIQVTSLAHFREFLFYQGRAQDTKHSNKALVIGRDGTLFVFSAYLEYHDEDMGGWYYNWSLNVEPIGNGQSIEIYNNTKVVSSCLD
jgi:hypothetical protein